MFMCEFMKVCVITYSVIYPSLNQFYSPNRKCGNYCIIIVKTVILFLMYRVDVGVEHVGFLPANPSLQSLSVHCITYGGVVKK